MASLGDVGEIQRNIELIKSVRDSYPDSHADVPYYNQIISDLSRDLAKAQGHHAGFAVATPISRSFTSFGPDSNSGTLHSRKRRLEPTDAPEAKRFSANASPLTPGTPLPGSEPSAPHSQQEWSLPNRPLQGYNWNAYNENAADLIDLTYSGPPSPDAQSQLNGFVDPFPELETAFRHDSARPQPVDAFNQEWMNEDELAQFLMAPTPANGGYAFQQHSAFMGAPNPRNAGYFMPANGLSVSNREVPYLPAPRRPDYMESDSDEYGTFPLDTHEIGALEKMLENVQRNADDDDPEDREQTPRIMQSTLKEYQKIGLTWLIKQEEGPTKGSILADEMGLGKTVQAIALMGARPSQDPLCKTTLVVAPVALMRQWEKEIARHILDRYKLHVYLYWGKGKNADFSRLRQFDVVLTTYGTLTSEYKQQETRREAMLNDREAREPKFKRKARDKLALLGSECTWYRIILDEAHMIKNRNSKASKAAAELRAKHRLCMTGTPMMNTIDELYPLLRFLRVNRYNDWRIFAQDIGKPVKNTRPEVRRNAMNRVQILLKTVMLRRQKSSEVDGQPILQLPAKHLSLDNVEFSDDEHAVYKALEEKSQVQFNKYLENGTISDNYACILVLILRLRQACCHPHLIKDLSQPATENIAEDDLLERARQLPTDVIERLKEFDGAECPICFDADPNPTIIIPCGHTVCGVCVQKLIDPNRPGQEIADEASVPKCPQCRGQLKAKLITDLKHFFRVHCPEKLDPADRVETDNENDSGSNSSEDDDDEEEDKDEVDRKGNLADFVVDDDDDEGEYTDSENVGTEGKGSASDSAKKSKKIKKSKGKGKARAKPKKTLAELKKESLRSKAAKKKYLRRLEKIWVPSAKISQTLEILNNIRRKDPTEKTLIFSQFTSLLDLVEIPLLQQKYRYQRYDGSLTMEARADAVDAFMEDPQENIMLVSLKAGNAGLNLWRASQVIMLDPFWNPFVEDQAVDRAHRMPQEREVTVHRVLVPETVEDRICALQDKKREIIGQALDEKEAKSLTRLGMRELKYLFGLT